MLEQLCDYFANGNRLYEEPQMTKEELTLQKENPEQKEQPEYIDEFYFSKPYQTEYEYVMQRSGRWNGWYEYYYETEHEIGFIARVDEGRDVDPVIRVLNYDPQVGNTTQFLYRKGYWRDEITLGYDLIFQTNYGMGGKNYAAYLSGLNEELQKEPEISMEEAISQVERLLADLEINDMDIASYNGDDIDEGWVYHHEIIDVQLRSTYINAFDDPMKVWLVPVWVFMTTGRIEGPEGKELPLAYTPTVINAIDGGVVTVRE